MFQPLMSWLKSLAFMNMLVIVVTLEVSHALMSSLKYLALDL